MLIYVTGGIERTQWHPPAVIARRQMTWMCTSSRVFYADRWWSSHKNKNKEAAGVKPSPYLRRRMLRRWKSAVISVLTLGVAGTRTSYNKTVPCPTKPFNVQQNRSMSNNTVQCPTKPFHVQQNFTQFCEQKFIVSWIIRRYRWRVKTN